VNNTPALDADILFAHYLPESIPVEAVRTLFPGRTLFVYHAKDGRLERIPDRGPTRP
jgi:hypothetical protein